MLVCKYIQIFNYGNIKVCKNANMQICLYAGRTEKNKISKWIKFREKFHVSIHRYKVHGLKKVIFVHFGLRSDL